MVVEIVQPTPIRILLVEDSSGDVRLAKEALREIRLRNVIHVAGDGMEAMEFLLRKGPWTDAPRPDLVLLDLNLPRMSGREVLAAIKSDPKLKRIPVVVLTISGREEDILKSYNLHANAYITKPIDLPQFLEVVRSIEEFWLTVSRLPQGER